MRKKKSGLLIFFFSLITFTTSILHADVSVDNNAAADKGRIKIKRDGFGMPLITGGKLQDIAQAIGSVQAQDRLWQIFFIVQTANGRASQYLGSDFIDSDILQHQINYTDAEVQNQIDSYFTNKTKTFYQNYIIGLNQYVAQVNKNPSIMPYELKAIGFGNSNPVPQFTLYDILRANQFILQQFSPSSIPSYQLDNLADLNILTGNFGEENALKIFNDIDPTSAQIKSPFTIVPNNNCISSFQHVTLPVTENVEPSSVSLQSLTQSAKELSKKINGAKKLRFKSGIPTLGSNGEVISAEKSVSGNPMIRIAPQPNFNHPSDFYQIWIDQNSIGFRGNYFTIPTFPVTPNGIFNNYGVGLQVGHLPSNDFLFEPVENAILNRTDTIQVLDSSPLVVPIYRSTSGGWVMTNPISSDTTSILTLRSVYIGKQLRAVNTFIESAFAESYDEMVNTLLNPLWQADILLVEGDYADSDNNISAFHTGGWTQLDSTYDRRLPQGIPQNPAPTNTVYSYDNIAKSPLIDKNNPQGFYVGWNSLFKDGAEGSSDTIFPVGVNRMYWLYEYLVSFVKLSFNDLKNIGLRQYLANNNTAFDDSDPDEDADLFTILFRDRFFQAVNNYPTPDRLQAIAFLQDFNGNWFDGDLDHILNGSDVSDKRILASVWLNAVANKILNPYLVGTTREVATATSAEPVPTFNSENVHNDLTSQANTLSRILNLACDNTLFFDSWLNNQPAVDEIIVQSLDFALNTLGGFNAQPWGLGKRGVYQFNNIILGDVQSMEMCNVSGLTLVAEFTPCQINMESVLALGESGEVLGNPPAKPKFNKHNFDQHPFFTQLQLRSNPPFKMSK